MHWEPHPFGQHISPGSQTGGHTVHIPTCPGRRGGHRLSKATKTVLKKVCLFKIKKKLRKDR